MLRLFIEFLGVKSHKTNGTLVQNAGSEPDDLRLDAFDHWGVKNLQPDEFTSDKAFIAGVHRTLCKINAHFSYDFTKPEPYDRVASLPDKDWERGVDIVLNKLVERFFRKTRQPIVVHFDLESDFRKRFVFSGLPQVLVKGDGLGPLLASSAGSGVGSRP